MAFDTRTYWDDRYRAGWGSGPGSRTRQAARKAQYVNAVVERERVRTIIDWGCGDGNVCCRFEVARYIGLDVSREALELCQKAIGDRPGWRLAWYSGLRAPRLPKADLALSLDVIFHLVDDALYRRHLEFLFGSAPLVLIHSSNRDEFGRPHVRHRPFLEDVPAGWSLLEQTEPNAEGIGMWLLQKTTGGEGQ